VLDFLQQIYNNSGMKKHARNAPVEVVETRDMKLPIYHRMVGGKYESFLVVFYEKGKRVQRTSATLEGARTIARDAIRQNTEGTGRIAALSPEQAADFSSAMRMLRAHPDLTLSGVVADYVRAVEVLGSRSVVTACEEYRKSLDRQSGFSPALLPDVYADFLKHIEKADASTRYLQDCKSRMGRAAGAFRCHVHAITTQDLSAWIDGLKIAPRTRRNMRTALVTLFAFAKQQGHLPRDRQTEAELLPARQRMNSTKREAAIGIYTPDDLRKILAGPENLRMVLAVAAFAGIRSAELHRLTWGDIKGDHIVVAADRSKTASRRIVPILPALVEWLKKVKRGEDDDRLCKNLSHASAFSRALNAAVRAAGVEPVHNGFRHSFCTYRLADIQNAAQVALEAGNSPAMLFRHYRELATRKEAKDWFAVTPGPKKSAEPARAKNVIPMPHKAA